MRSYTQQAFLLRIFEERIVNVSIPREPSTEPVSIPDNLDPSQATGMFPSLNVENLTSLRAAGFARVGIGAAVFDEQMRLMVLTHKSSPKTFAGQLGILSETTEFARDENGVIHIETTAQTLARGLYEEVGIERPETLRLGALRLGAWFMQAWPVGGYYIDQDIIAVSPVIHVDKDQREEMQDVFQETEEISAIQFMTPEALVAERNVRAGTHTWLGHLMTSNLARTSSDERTPITLPGLARLDGAQDVIFDTMDL